MAIKTKTVDEGKQEISLLTNEALPTLFVDNLIINTRVDGISLIRFSTLLPEGLKEQARMLIPKEHLNRMLDALCKHCDYFPQKEKPKRKSKKKTT